MDEQTTGQPDAPDKPDYERMCIDLYTWRFGAIDFLELVGRFEQALGIRLKSTKGGALHVPEHHQMGAEDRALDETERTDTDVAVVEADAK